MKKTKKEREKEKNIIEIYQGIEGIVRAVEQLDKECLYAMEYNLRGMQSFIDLPLELRFIKDEYYDYGYLANVTTSKIPIAIYYSEGATRQFIYWVWVSIEYMKINIKEYRKMRTKIHKLIFQIIDKQSTDYGEIIFSMSQILNDMRELSETKSSENLKTTYREVAKLTLEAYREGFCTIDTNKSNEYMERLIEAVTRKYPGIKDIREKQIKKFTRNEGLYEGMEECEIENWF
ncbi:MAG: hypothetical protein FWC68_03580 [Oscillospiraceae bacterium]|nr:hypothetical protein [Oscillospiraceae bacterium]